MRRTANAIAVESDEVLGSSSARLGAASFERFHAGMAWLLVVVAVVGFAPRSLAIVSGTMPNAAARRASARGGDGVVGRVAGRAGDTVAGGPHGPAPQVRPRVAGGRAAGADHADCDHHRAAERCRRHARRAHRQQHPVRADPLDRAVPDVFHLGPADTAHRPADAQAHDAARDADAARRRDRAHDLAAVQRLPRGLPGSPPLSVAADGAGAAVRPDPVAADSPRLGVGTRADAAVGRRYRIRLGVGLVARFGPKLVGAG